MGAVFDCPCSVGYWLTLKEFVGNHPRWNFSWVTLDWAFQVLPQTSVVRDVSVVGDSPDDGAEDDLMIAMKRIHFPQGRNADGRLVEKIHLVLLECYFVQRKQNNRMSSCVDLREGTEERGS